MGTVSFVPLSVYRYAHARHHAYLGSERDPELWPFNSPAASRLVRLSAAGFEILLGILYTPLLFLRSVVRGPLSPQERRAVVRGYLAALVYWTGNLILVHFFIGWELFAVVVLVPLAISGTLQTLNKYTQHLGLHGHSVLGLTRTVVDQHRLAKGVSASMLYNDYHGTHHRYAKIPYYNLPAATPYTLETAQEACPVFPNLASAVIDMLSCLANPTVGPQWTRTLIKQEDKEQARLN